MNNSLGNYHTDGGYVYVCIRKQLGILSHKIPLLHCLLPLQCDHIYIRNAKTSKLVSFNDKINVFLFSLLRFDGILPIYQSNFNMFFYKVIFTMAPE